MKKIIVFALSLFMVSYAHSADYYHVGDSLFVWAKSGLNVRSAPSTKASIVEKIPFGDKITIAEWCDKAFYIKAVDPIEDPYNEKEVVGPFILKGQWVKIVTSSGKTGFIINQYILFQEPHNKKHPTHAMPNLTIIQTDTILANQDINAEDIYMTIKTQYEGGIESTATISEVTSDYRLEFKDLSMQEVFVLMTSSWDNMNEYHVVRNWVHSIHFTDTDEVCYFSIEWINGIVVVEAGCSC